ncbi:hypothetical protein Tco_0112073 [Tanacetum coccineum]
MLITGNITPNLEEDAFISIKRSDRGLCHDSGLLWWCSGEGIQGSIPEGKPEKRYQIQRKAAGAQYYPNPDTGKGSADVAYRTPLAPYEKSKFLGSGGSMVARLKLKGIDGRAPPGVEPAA